MTLFYHPCDCARGFAAGHIRGCAVLVSDRLRKALDLVRVTASIGWRDISATLAETAIGREAERAPGPPLPPPGEIYNGSAVSSINKQAALLLPRENNRFGDRPSAEPNDDVEASNDTSCVLWIVSACNSRTSRSCGIAGEKVNRVVPFDGMTLAANL